MIRRRGAVARFTAVWLCLVLIFGGGPVAANEPTVRIKDIARVDGVRTNQLVGLGLVIGLEGTGDGRSQVGNQMMSNLLQRFNVGILPDQVRTRNVAVVMVTAELPAFARPGDRIDVTVSSIGDSRSLAGGYLLMTPLQAGNGEVYAVAQGPISVGGFSLGGAGASVQRNFSTVGRIPGGAIVERQAPGQLMQNGVITLVLNEADFTTAQRVVDAINEMFTPETAIALDNRAIRVTVPSVFANNPVLFISLLEEIRVTPDSVARVIINERTGTIVMGHNVRIATVAVSHGGLTVKIERRTEVTVPVAPDDEDGEITYRTETRIEVEESKNGFTVLPAGATVDELVAALNAIGATPQDIIAILQAIKAAGALYAELVVL